MPSARPSTACSAPRCRLDPQLRVATRADARAPRPAAPGAPRAARPRRMDQPRRARLRLPPPLRRAGRGLRRRVVLRPLLVRASSRDASCMPASTSRARSPAGPLEGEASPCLGLCERAPAALVVEAGEAPIAAPVHDGEWDAAWSVPQRGQPGLVLLAGGRRRPVVARLVRVARWLRRAAQGDRDRRAAVVDEVTRSGLVGRGGAAFPTGRKWQAVAAHASTPHYLVANADESEPGTFKDRVVIENDPFSIVEAMTIAGFATGCERGYLYLRGEYPHRVAADGGSDRRRTSRRLPGRRHPRARRSLRHRDAQGRGRVHLR